MKNIRQTAFQAAECALAKRKFFKYCNIKAPDFYKKDRAFLKRFCKDLQDFYESDDEVLVVNMPPRHGKSRTIGCFVEWVLGNNQTEKIMTGSYNETLSTTFSKGVRNTITEQKVDESKIVYSDIFPGVTIKRGDGAMNMWSLENGYNNYLATSPKGTATGFGATLMIIDDLIKSASEANNANVLEEHWGWFVNTMLSRLEEGGKIIIVMTRWHSLDLAGRALEHYKRAGAKLKHISYQAQQEDGTMLCPEILSAKSYEGKRKAMSLDIVEANYQQNPIDIKGRLYTTIKTYTETPKDDQGNSLFHYILNYTDTADEGSDFLCSICYGMYADSYYILDVLYTKEAMEVTEPATAKMLTRNNVGCALIESNNGGRGFARNVARECKEMGNKHTNIKWFHQSQNKVARILSNSTSVMNNIYFPVNWEDKWPDFARDIKKYQREGKNEHDDAPDALTGVYENPKPLGKWLM